ncbi:hypothetical protein [Nostoc sp.]
MSISQNTLYASLSRAKIAIAWARALRAITQLLKQIIYKFFI